MSSTEINVGETRSGIRVNSRKRLNDTGVRVSKGQRFRVHADSGWNDGGIDTGPDGFDIDTDAPLVSRWLLKLFVPLLRVPTSRYFCLIGSIDGEKATFVQFGSGLDEWLATADNGHLQCFANDVPGFYWNNRGSVSMTITRTA